MRISITKYIFGIVLLSSNLGYSNRWLPQITIKATLLTTENRYEIVVGLNWDIGNPSYSIEKIRIESLLDEAYYKYKIVAEGLKKEIKEIEENLNDNHYEDKYNKMDLTILFYMELKKISIINETINYLRTLKGR